MSGEAEQLVIEQGEVIEDLIEKLRNVADNVDSMRKDCEFTSASIDYLLNRLGKEGYGDIGIDGDFSGDAGMTDDGLDLAGIRNGYAAARFYGTINSLWRTSADDVPELIDEVERLRDIIAALVEQPA